MATMSPLRRRMIEDMTVRNLSPATQQSYLYAVAKFSRHFSLPPAQLGTEQVRAYQLHLIAQKRSKSHINQVACALRFFYGVTLGQKEAVARIVSGREPEKLPPVLNPAETDRDEDAASKVGPLLDQVADPVASFTGDGAYDQESVYADVAERPPDADVVVPPRSTAVPSATAETAPTQRDCHLQLIAEKGRMGWQKASGYNARARAEATIGRFKRVIGDGLRSHTDERRATEMDVAIQVLNRMLELGRPTYVRIT